MWWSLGGSAYPLRGSAGPRAAPSDENAPLARFPLAGSIPRDGPGNENSRSWKRLRNVVEPRGIEPLTSWLPAMRSPS